MEREKGPIEILCREIDFRFDDRMENVPTLVAFVRILVDEIAYMRDMQGRVAKMVSSAAPVPSDDSGLVLSAARAMLDARGVDALIGQAAHVHDLTHQFNPDDGPCDHFIDMLSSCASAIRFGLEQPCHSRHAASAADHVWKHRYGISLFDEFTSGWRNDWARAQLQDAILSLTPTAPVNRFDGARTIGGPQTEAVKRIAAAGA